MTHADIFTQALESPSPTVARREPEGERISVGGTMLQPINDSSFAQIHEEAQLDARRIVRGQPEPKAHRMWRDRSGFGPSDSVTPTCSCGWKGRAEYESDDFMSTKLAAQEREHLQGEGL